MKRSKLQEHRWFFTTKISNWNYLSVWVALRADTENLVSLPVSVSRPVFPVLTGQPSFDRSTQSWKPDRDCKTGKFRYVQYIYGLLTNTDDILTTLELLWTTKPSVDHFDRVSDYRPVFPVYQPGNSGKKWERLGKSGNWAGADREQTGKLGVPTEIQNGKWVSCSGLVRSYLNGGYRYRRDIIVKAKVPSVVANELIAAR